MYNCERCVEEREESQEARICTKCVSEIQEHYISAIKQLEKELKRYKSLSLHDYLTGLFNRRKLKIDLKRYLELQKRHNTNFLVLMIDIDNFKQINDTKGHKKGDKVLKTVAKIIKNNIRKIDKAYRYGGDEFIIVSSHCKKDNISSRIIKYLKREDISISIGIAKLSDNILEIVEQKMYEEKMEIK